MEEASPRLRTARIAFLLATRRGAAVVTEGHRRGRCRRWWSQRCAYRVALAAYARAGELVTHTAGKRLVRAIPEHGAEPSLLCAIADGFGNEHASGRRT